jgi:hypothetical protein
MKKRVSQNQMKITNQNKGFENKTLSCGGPPSMVEKPCTTTMTSNKNSGIVLRNELIGNKSSLGSFVSTLQLSFTNLIDLRAVPEEGGDGETSFPKESCELVFLLASFIGSLFIIS